MSQANIEIARRAAELANAGDLEAVAELYHPDAEARDLQPGPDMPEVMIGRAAIVRVWEQWLEALDEWRVEVHELVDADPWVVSDTHWYATGKGSAVPIDWRVAEAHEFEDGKVIRSLFGFPDVAAALEAVEKLRTSENEEVVRRANAAFNRSDVEGFLAFCSDDIEVEDLKNAPDLPPVARGKDEVRQTLAAWVAAFDDFSGEIEEYIDVDDRHVACLVHYRGTARNRGMEVDFRAIDLWEVRGSKLVRGTLGYADRKAVLEAVSSSTSSASA